MRPGPRRGEAGDAQRGDRRSRAAVQTGDVALDQERLRGVRPDPGGGGQHLDGAGLFAAVGPAGHIVLDRDGLPGQGVRGREQAGLVVLDGRENVVGGLVFDQMAGGFPLGVHRIQRDHRAAQAQRLQQWLDLDNLIGQPPAGLRPRRRHGSSPPAGVPRARQPGPRRAVSCRLLRLPARPASLRRLRPHGQRARSGTSR